MSSETCTFRKSALLNLFPDWSSATKGQLDHKDHVDMLISKSSMSSVWPTERGKSFAEKYPIFMRGLLVVLWFLGILALFVAVKTMIIEPGVFGQDSHAYWLAAQGELAYSRPAGTADAYLYSPFFLTLIFPLTFLPWPVFLLAWTVLLLAVFWWLVKPLGLKWAAPLLLCCLPEILVSNIFLLLGLAAVIGTRWPAAWVFPILTKVTMGVGLLWFVARGEWRRFAQGLVATLAVIAVSYILGPEQWHAWVTFLLTNRDGTRDGQTSFVLRCVLAAVLVTVGARMNWGWLIAPAMLLASPVLVSVVPAALLVAMPRLVVATQAASVPTKPSSAQLASTTPR